MTLCFKRNILDLQRKEKQMKFTLKALRSLKNWTQLEAAEALGVSVDTWGNWERGKNAPSYSKIEKIVEVFGVPYDDIIFLPNITV